MDEDLRRMRLVRHFPRNSALLRISFRDRSNNPHPQGPQSHSPLRLGLGQHPFSVSLNELDSKMDDKNRISLISTNEIRALEHQTLKVPYEILNKKFRTAQKNIDREVFHVQKSLNQLEKTVGEVNTGGNDNDLTVGHVTSILEDVLAKLQTLKRKSIESIDEEIHSATLCKKRLDHLKQSDTENFQDLDRWKNIRMDRMLVDHCLRKGFYDTAIELSREMNIEEMTNVDIFLVCRDIESSLRERDTSKCLAWCHDNKSKLRKINSTLEFRLRKQDFIELIRNNKRIEAVRYSKKYLTSIDDFNHVSKELESVMGLLAHSFKYGPERYRHLLDEGRWDGLIKQFREENFIIYQLSTSSVFSITLQSGLSVMKTLQCFRRDGIRNPECPVCSDLLNELAADLPCAHCSQSKLVCKLSGQTMNENNLPMMLPNGMVYGELALKHMAAINNGKVICPRTNEVYDYDKLQKVYVM